MIHSRGIMYYNLHRWTGLMNLGLYHRRGLLNRGLHQRTGLLHWGLHQRRAFNNLSRPGRVALYSPAPASALRRVYTQQLTYCGVIVNVELCHAVTTVICWLERIILFTARLMFALPISFRVKTEFAYCELKCFIMVHYSLVKSKSVIKASLVR